MLLTFSKFFRQYFDPIILEMDQANIDKIEDSIMNVEERPFPELFGNRERFIEKVYSPEFIKLCSEFSYNLDPKRFDIDKGYYIDSKGNKYRYGELFKKIMEYDTEWESPEKVQKRISKLKQMLRERSIFSYMVFSRHPIDVLRMSDMNDIESCHSKGRMYFDCAQNEAKNLGGIIYVLTKQDAGRVKNNLNDREIFEDPERNIKGIKPIARVRLRRFIDQETGEDFAVPEKSYYVPKGSTGGYDNRYIDDILQYTKDHQKISKSNLDSEYIEKNIAHVGGQYSDTDFQTLLGRFFGRSEYDLGEIKSYPAIPITNKQILGIIQSLEHSNNPDEILGKMDAEKVFRILHGLKYWETQEGVEYPKAKEYLLARLNDTHIDRWDHREGLMNLIGDGTDISRYPKLMEKVFGSLNDILYDLPYNTNYNKENINNFISVNSDGIKNYLKMYPFKESSFYRIRELISPLVEFLQKEGDPTNLVKFMKQNYFEIMADLDISNRNNINGFLETFGTSLFQYLDETNQWEEFLTIGGGFYPYEDWFSGFSPRKEIFNYPRAIQTSLNLIDKALREGDESSLLAYGKFIANNVLTKYISENYNVYGNIFSRIIKNLVTLDLDRIDSLRYYLNIANLIQGDSPLIGEELEKYKQSYIDAFKNALNRHGKYLSDDYIKHMLPLLNKLRDGYGWYELKNLQDGPLDIIDNILKSKDRDQTPSDIKI